MLLFENHARLLLVVHALLGVAAVGASTHLVIWLRGFLRGRFNRYRAARRFSYIALALFACTFLIGNALYPTYKVRVRTEYLENARAVASDHADRAQVARDTVETYRTMTGAQVPAPPPDPTADAAQQGAVRAASVAKIARWFDVKEHWVALGFILSAGCAVLLTAWDPRRDSAAIAPIVFGFAACAAATAWLAAIVGLVTSSFRAVG